MAKSNPFQVPSKGILPKFIWTVVLLAVGAIIVKHPANAAAVVTGAGAFLGGAVDGVATFLQNVAT